MNINSIITLSASTIFCTFGLFLFVYKEDVIRKTIGVILLMVGIIVIVAASPNYKRLTVYKNFEKEVELERKQGMHFASEYEFKVRMILDDNGDIVSVGLISGTGQRIK